MVGVVVTVSVDSLALHRRPAVPNLVGPCPVQDLGVEEGRRDSEEGSGEELHHQSEELFGGTGAVDVSVKGSAVVEVVVEFVGVFIDMRKVRYSVLVVEEGSPMHERIAEPPSKPPSDAEEGVETPYEHVDLEALTEDENEENVSLTVDEAEHDGLQDATHRPLRWTVSVGKPDEGESTEELVDGHERYDERDGDSEGQSVVGVWKDTRHESLQRRKANEVSDVHDGGEGDGLSEADEERVGHDDELKGEDADGAEKGRGVSDGGGDGDETDGEKQEHEGGEGGVGGRVAALDLGAEGGDGGVVDAAGLCWDSDGEGLARGIAREEGFGLDELHREGVDDAEGGEVGRCEVPCGLHLKKPRADGFVREHRAGEGGHGRAGQGKVGQRDMPSCSQSRFSRKGARMTE